ncbi:histidine phosphatase superfamily [Melanogaster broomeanus]|nr:histidine phosphatase superfamily [Melanogaster broomeanus]
MVSKVLGVLILARNGDRREYHQDPYTYAPSLTESTSLGAVESFQLGSYLRSTYLDSSSPLHIRDMPLDPSHPIPPNQVHVHAKSGGEGAAIFDSSIALLQGMFPPTPLNRLSLANGSTIASPLGGYQYVPVQMATEGGDLIFEPWIDCKAFKKHVTEVYASEEFKETTKDAQPFFGAVHDYMFGRSTTLENIWNVFDYMNTQLIYNQTFAFRLPPTLIEQARGFANYKENAVFSAKDLGSIGNLAGRTILSPIIKSLERIAFDDDPLRVLLMETSYQPFVSLFHMLDMVSGKSELSGIPNYASALSFELLRGPAPELRDFVRVKFKNGTHDAEFQTVHLFGHPEAMVPVTEFIYRLEHNVIADEKQWSSACSTSWFPFPLEIGASITSENTSMSALCAIASLFAFGMCAISAFMKYSLSKRAKRYGALKEIEYYDSFSNEKSRMLP